MDSAPADSLSWPGEDWATGTPEGHGLDAAALDALQDYVFSDANYSQALAVFKDGVLVYEHYADDAEVETPVTSWSAAKSVTSALIGVAIREGHIELDDPVSEVITEWAEGPNAAITIRDMLEMQSGLPENTSTHSACMGGFGLTPRAACRAASASHPAPCCCPPVSAQGVQQKRDGALPSGPDATCGCVRSHPGAHPHPRRVLRVVLAWCLSFFGQKQNKKQPLTAPLKKLPKKRLTLPC